MPKSFNFGFHFSKFGPQTLTGTAGRDVILGGFGDDLITGGADRDILFGGFGNDTLEGGAGPDRIFGGFGTDTASYEGSIADYDIDVTPARGKFAPVKARVTDGNGDTDRLHGVERLYFAADDYTADLTGDTNNAVLARDDAADANADQAATITGLTDNDFDFDGDALTILGLDTADLAGTATLNADGTITYDANGAFDGLAEGETAQTVLRYTVTDGRGSVDTASVTITVTGVNDRPDLDVADTSVAENETAVLTAAATDPDGDALTYTVSGTDAALFTINAATGELSFIAAPDFEAPADAGGDNVYDITITAEDAGGLSDSADVAITVTDVDEVTAYFNEIHYDNSGADTGEFIEIAGDAGADLTGWQIVLYNGSNGTAYDTVTLDAPLSDGADGIGYLAIDIAGIQNGAPDGFALVRPGGSVVEFLSYEGTLTAVGGPADGLTSEDIGVSESSGTPAGFSLQRGDDGIWREPAPETKGADNTPPQPETTAFLNEIHYDNTGADTGEFVEIAGTAGADLSGWSLVFYNGSNGQAYNTVTLDQSLSGTTGIGYLAIEVAGIQNGAPDGIALVRPDASVAEFLSYEGVLTAVGGPADGLTSEDIGVSEPGSTPVGFSLQRQPDGSWAAPAPANPGLANDADAPLPAVTINELAISTTGTDWEFLELSGEPGTSLDGLRFVQVRGTGETGEVIRDIDLTGGAIGESGFFLLASPQAETTFGVTGDQAIANNTFQNTASTFILVKADDPITGDLDPANTGILDPALRVVDSVALTENADDINYSDVVVGPSGSFLPAGVARNDAGGFDILSFNDSSVYSPTPGAAAPPPPPPTGTALISTVQGAGDSSAFVGQIVSVEAVVTQVLSNGFFLQEEASDYDADAATSEGIFVFTGGVPSVSITDVVFATGTVGEFNQATQLSNVTLEVLGNAVLPTPEEIAVGSLLGMNLEQFEGMQVSLTSGSAQPLTVIENFELGRFGEIVVSEGIQFNPTQIFDPQDDAAEIAALLEANAANRITIDDGNSSQNPDFFEYVPNNTAGDNGNGYLDAGDNFDLGGTLRLGAELTAPVTGALNERNGEYKVIPTGMIEIDPATNDGARQPQPSEVGGDLKVVSFNALNYFTTLGERGAQTAGDLERQTEKLVEALVRIDGDIIGLQEVENNGFGEGSAIAALVDAVNARLGSDVYAIAAPDLGGATTLGTDAITTGMIYKQDVVTLQGVDSLIFDDGGQQRNRPAIAAAFEDETGEVFTVAVNHFKSKGGSGTGDDADIGDGQGNFNGVRTDAANQLTAWLATDPLETGDPDFLIIGDLNAYLQEDPVQAIEAAGYTNLLEQYLTPETAYSFTFDGQRGALDHALATGSMAQQIEGLTEWHVASPEPSLLGYSTQFGTSPGWYNGSDPYAASDHDPLIIGVSLGEDEFILG